MEGRKEKRNSQRFQVLLSSLAQPLYAEQASTEDITSYGMRVQTEPALESGFDFACQNSQGRAFCAGKSCLLRTAFTQNIWSGIGVSSLTLHPSSGIRFTRTPRISR